jgi:hypothetical protein
MFWRLSLQSTTETDVTGNNSVVCACMQTQAYVGNSHRPVILILCDMVNFILTSFKFCFWVLRHIITIILYTVYEFVGCSKLCHDRYLQPKSPS